MIDTEHGVALSAEAPSMYDRVRETLGPEADHALAAARGAEAMAWSLTRVKLAARAMATLDLLEAHDPHACGAVVSSRIEHLSAGLPCPILAAVRDNALYWAETAVEIELVEYLAAALRQLGERGLMRAVLPARKRLMVALFQSLPEEDRRAFLARVDPRGLFTGRAA